MCACKNAGGRQTKRQRSSRADEDGGGMTMTDEWDAGIDDGAEGPGAKQGGSKGGGTGGKGACGGVNGVQG